jgi:type I restriction enzyme, R subunit
MPSHFRAGFQYSGLKVLARELRRNQTTAEAIFWNAVKNRKFLNLKFRRQHQIGLYIVDFYCPEYGIVVELDGEIHHLAVNKQKDKERDLSLKVQGYKVFRFLNDRILNDLDYVLNELSEYISSIPPSPHGRGAGGEG